MNPVLASLTPEQREYLADFFGATSYRTGNVNPESIVSWIDVDLNQVGEFTLEDMSTITGLSPLTLRQYVREKKIVAYKKWREYMVTANEIARFMYQRDTGNSIPPDIAVGVVIVDRDYSDDYHEFIGDFKFFNVLDVKDWFDYDFDRCRLRAYGKHGNTVKISIELMGTFRDFYTRVGLLPRDVPDEEDVNIKDHFYVNRNLLKEMRQIAYRAQKKSEALKRIRDVFGELGEEATLLKMYRELMEAWYEYDELEVYTRRYQQELEELRNRVEDLQALRREDSPIETE